MPSPLQQLQLWLGELGRISDEPSQLTRTFLSPAMTRAVEQTATYMQSAGLTTRVDTVGNLIGRYVSASPNAKTLLLGSHLDTVRNAGKYDGPLGVLLPIAVMAELQRRCVALPFHVEVVGFSEEEGVRFASGYLGSMSFTGQLRRGDLELRDGANLTVRQVLEAHNGDVFIRPKAAHGRRDLLGYVEVHIEQGPVLEAKGLAVGVVSAIAGQSRFKLTWTGKAGHAGTTPMKLRRDAFAGVAEFAVEVEALARRTRGLVATIGSVQVAPGASNVIPGEVVHTLDVRHADDRTRLQALQELERITKRLARARGLTCDWRQTQDDGAVACSPELTKQLERSVRTVQGRSLSLVSGAGHDAVVMSRHTPVAMLFVRCRDGLSHHPDEFASPRDIGVAFQVMLDFLQKLATTD